MDAELNRDIEFFQALCDNMPMLIFVVDEDVRIINRNKAATNFLGKDDVTLHMRRGGDVLHCIHSKETTDGCGYGEYCRQCVIRNGVNAAYAGTSVYRTKYRMVLCRDGEEIEIYLMITTAPIDYKGERYALLILEDISEVVQLQSLLPICMHCKKIRKDDTYWETVEEYLSTRIDVEFSHGVCPDCRDKYYGDLLKGKE